MLYTYDLQQRKTAALENAFQIVEDESLNSVSMLKFSLPAADPKNQHCKPFHMLRWDNGPLYRIADSSTEIRDVGTITYSAEHVLSSLIDNISFGTYTLDNLPTRTVIEKVLSLQKTKKWVLGECDFTQHFSYSWSNENLLAMLFSIPNQFDQKYKWTLNTDVYPWVIHLNRLDENADPEYYIRDGKNLLSSIFTRKGRDICTRIYGLGYGEGINQLTFKDINDGKPYVENTAATQEYGLIERIWEDGRFEVSENLLSRANVLLSELSKPYDVITAKVADIEKMTGEYFDTPEAGKIVQIGHYKSYINRVVRKLDVVGEDVVEIANKPEDIAGTIAEQADRARINRVYAQGQTVPFTQNFADNADPTHPAVIKCYIPPEARAVNKVILTWELEAFRAYETGASSDGGGAQSSSSGGGTAKSTDSGGGATSGTGGQATVSSSSGSGVQSATSQPYPLDVAYAKHYHIIYGVTHTHTVTTPSHSHTVPAHSHNFTIPAHSHNVDIPSHTHDIIYGIYTGPSASSVTLKVDGQSVPLQAGQSEIDVAPYLSVDNAGKIQRGTFHRIEIVPNSLTRITATMYSQIFIQSEGGGHY